MPIHPLPANQLVHLNPSIPLTPDGHQFPVLWIPCYTANAWDESPVRVDVTQERLSSDLQRSLENVNQSPVYFPDWFDRFGMASEQAQSNHNPLLEQLKTFVLRPEYQGLCMAVQQHFANIESWFFSQRVESETSSQNTDTERLQRVSDGFGQFTESFTERYLPAMPDLDFFNSLNPTFLEVYQRSCLDILSMGHTALALGFGLRMGDAHCVAWCREAGNRLLQTLDDLSSPGGAWTVCEPGMVTHMADAVLALRRALFPPDLAVRFLDLREKLFEQTIIETGFPVLQNTVFNLPGNEVHVVNAWRDNLKDRYFLRPREKDVFSVPSMLGSISAYTRIINSLDHSMSPAATVGSLADQCRSEFASHFADPAAPLDASVMQSAYQNICKTWGELPLTVLVDTDQTEGKIHLQETPDLLIAWLLDTLVNANDVPTGLKEGLLLLQAYSIALGEQAPHGSAASMHAGSPRLFSFYDSRRNMAVVWVQRAFRSSDGIMRFEYAHPDFDDFSMELLARIFRHDGRPWLDESDWAQQETLFRGLVNAYLRGSADAVRDFAALPGSHALGLVSLRKWPVGQNQWHARQALFAQLGADSPILHCTSRMYRVDWMQQTAKVELLLTCLRQQNGSLLAHLIASGHVSPDLPLLGQYASLQVTAELVAVANIWFDGVGPGESPAVSVSIAQCLDSPSWRLRDEERAQIRQSLDIYRNGNPPRLRMEPEIPSDDSTDSD